MNTTSPSLLDRLRHPHEGDAWDRFVRLYTPLLMHWARQTGLREPDAADLVQEVFALLVRKLPEFTYDPSRSFRAWLRTVAMNKWREWLRREAPVAVEGSDALDRVTAPDAIGVFEEEEYRRFLVRQAMHDLRPEFPASTWEAFRRYAVDGQQASRVAAELGQSVGTVYAAKSRVLARLREELVGLLE